MNDELIEKIRSVVSDFTINDRVFTVVDVAAELRNSGVNDFEYPEIRQAVHDMFEHNMMPRDYDRKYVSIQINGAAATVWAYHPSWEEDFSEQTCIYDSRPKEL